MIDIEKLKKEKVSIVNTLDQDMTKGMANKIKKRLSFLIDCIRYLESHPTEEFLKKEQDRLAKRIVLLKAGFKDWLPDKQYDTEKKQQIAYYKECKIPSLNNHLKTIKFLLQS